MKELVNSVLSARKKAYLGSVPVYERYAEYDLHKVKASVGVDLPSSLSYSLSEAGYGGIRELSFREEWFSVIDRGELEGHIIFAQDDVGNFYSFCTEIGLIHYICRVEPEYACIANTFSDFLRELVVREYRLREWYEGLEGQPYTW